MVSEFAFGMNLIFVCSQFPSVLPTQRKSLSLRKVPNTQKSLSLVKSKITSNSIVHRTAAGHHLSETEVIIFFSTSTVCRNLPFNPKC